MLKIINFIRQIFSKKILYARNVLSGTAELTAISKHGFLHPERQRIIHQDLVVLLIASNFVAKPGVILSFYARNYDFSLDEMVVLSYKLGMLTQLYIENPTYLLEDGLKLDHLFSEETIQNLKSALEDHKVIENKKMKQQYEKFRVSMENDKLKNSNSKLNENEEADKMIEEWLKLNKKKN